MFVRDDAGNEQRDGEKCTQGTPHPSPEGNRQKDEERIESEAVSNDHGCNDLPLQSRHEDPEYRRNECVRETRKAQDANYKERGHDYRWTEIGNETQRACEHPPKKWIRQPHCPSQSNRKDRETEIDHDKGAEIPAHLLLGVIQNPMCHLARPIAREEESNAGFDFIR